MSQHLSLNELYQKLSDIYGIEDWWHSESPFEVMVGAILTQQTVWETVTKVLDDMRNAGLLDVNALTMSDGTLERVIRPTGFYNQKAQNLREMSIYLLKWYDGDVMAMLTGKDLMSTRKELLSLRGIGKETADSILLFAANRPKFVAAAYVSRILLRIGTFDSKEYDKVQAFVESELPRTTEAYKEFYALCVHHSKRVCHSRPKCDECPLMNDCLFAINRTGI